MLGFFRRVISKPVTIIDPVEADRIARGIPKGNTVGREGYDKENPRYLSILEQRKIILDNRCPDCGAQLGETGVGGTAHQVQCLSCGARFMYHGCRHNFVFYEAERLV